jgi:hypothetical protein
MQDNPVNMMLLSTYMKKNNWDFETGVNGLLALQTFENRPQGFDIIFMGESLSSIPPQFLFLIFYPHPFALYLSVPCDTADTKPKRHIYAHNDRIRIHSQDPRPRNHPPQPGWHERACAHHCLDRIE